MNHTSRVIVALSTPFENVPTSSICERLAGDLFCKPNCIRGKVESSDQQFSEDILDVAMSKGSALEEWRGWNIAWTES